MDKIEFDKKYLISCYNYESEAVYLGQRKKRTMKNTHLFMVWHSFMKGDEKPVIIGCQNFRIHDGNKLETISSKMHFPNLSEKEKEFVTELAKKYWK